MQTLLAAFINPVREILGDELASYFADSEIEMLVKTMVRLNKLPGFKLSPDQMAIVPGIDGGSKQMRLLSLHTAKSLLLPRPSLPNKKTTLFEIESKIYNLENYG